jgi:hypothetical protein
MKNRAAVCGRLAVLPVIVSQGHDWLGKGHASDVRRRGATLSEVLVSLLIMAIGVVSLASLFPISVLKTARASQLTVATNVRNNAESMMKLYPHIYQDPTQPPYNNVGFSVGQPFLFDPQATLVTRMEPMPGSAAYTAVPRPCGVGLLSRWGGGFDVNADAADAICAGPDSWTLRHEGTISNPSATQMNVSELSSLDFSSLPAAGGIRNPGKNQMRVQIFFNSGKSSVSRMITGIGAGNSLIWTEDVNGNSMLDPGEDQNGNFSLDMHSLPGLPAGMSYETARLESRERRYTWMLTVRPNVDVKVVVYYGRGFSNDEEQIYGTAPPMSTVTIPNLVAGSSVTMPPPNTQSNVFTVTWPAGQQPFLKRGGFVFDAQYGNWYQIENYSDPGFGNSSTVTLTSNLFTPPAAANPCSLLMFPRGVVDVFPIDTP